MTLLGVHHILHISRIKVKQFVVFMTVLHTHFYSVVDTQRGCHTLKKESTTFYPLVDYVFLYECINLH